MGRHHRRATSPSGSWACSCSTTTSPTGSPSTCWTPPRSSPRRRSRSAGSAAWSWTGWWTTSSPRPSRWPSAPRTSCPASTSPTIRSCRAGTSPTSTPSSSGWAVRTSPTCPVNAPKCPFAHFQQDGQMAMTNPQGRVNYEPNSWDAAGGPREDPAAGFAPIPTAEATAGQARLRRRASPTTTARPAVLISQAEVERRHIVDAFTFELSKCDRAAIRTRMVAALRNVDDELAAPWPTGLGLRRAARRGSRPAREPRARPGGLPGAEHPGQRPGQLRRPQDRHPGHRGSDAASWPRSGAAEQEKVTVELSHPAVGGVEISDGSVIRRPEDRRRPLGPVRRGRRARRPRAARRHWPPCPAARDFVTDAYAHCKFIAVRRRAGARRGDRPRSLMDDGSSTETSTRERHSVSRCG